MSGGQDRPPEALLLAGPNGAGKTTASRVLVPSGVAFLNADVVAERLRSGGHPEPGIEVATARTVLRTMRELEDVRESFCLETNLAGRGWVGAIRRWHLLGYRVGLVFLALSSPELALERVALRVASGGHDVPEAVVRRRWASGLRSLFDTYLDLVDDAVVRDHSGRAAVLVAEGGAGRAAVIHDERRWTLLRQMARVERWS